MRIGKHSLLMIVGCAIPLVGIILLPLLGVKLGGVLPLLFVLACPLSMILMMASMSAGHNHVGHRGNGSEPEEKALCHEDASPSEAPAPRTLMSPSKKG